MGLPGLLALLFLTVVGRSCLGAFVLVEPLPGSIPCFPKSEWPVSSHPSGLYSSVTFSLKPFLATVSTISTPPHPRALLSASFSSLLLITNTLGVRLIFLFIDGLHEFPRK